MVHIIRQGKQDFVDARDLYQHLELSERFSKWYDRMIGYGFECPKDYTPYQMVHPQNKQEIASYLLTVQMAREVAMIQRTPQGKAIRDYLLDLDNKVEEGLLLGGDILPAIVELIQLFSIHEYRMEAERFHYQTFCQTHYKGEWHGYRVSLLGYSKETLTSAMAQIGEKYQSIEKSLMKLDKYELIKTSFVDLFLHLGKSEVYAKNVGELASQMAKKMNLSFDSLKSALFGNLHPQIEFRNVVEQIA